MLRDPYAQTGNRGIPMKFDSVEVFSSSRRAFLIRESTMLGVLGFSWPLAGFFGRRIDSTASSWHALTQDLARVLPEFGAGQYLILEDGASGYYVQFAFLSGGFRAEAVSNDYLPDHRKLTRSAISSLGALGWKMPESLPDVSRTRSSYSRSNFYRHFLWSGPPHEPSPFGQAAELVVRSLRDVYAAEHPAQLRYTAFQRQRQMALVPDPGLAQRHELHHV